MGTVRVGMARLWLGWWPLPADEDMALGAGCWALSGRAAAVAAVAAAAEAAAAGGSGLLRLL